MLLSKFLGLKKPEQDDFYNIEDFNSNTDLIDETFEELSKNKVDLGQAKIFDESYSVTQFSDSAYFKNFLYGLILNGLISLSLFLYVKTISLLGIHSFRYILLSIVYVL